MELSPSGVAASCSATTELSNISWNPKIPYSVHKRLPLISILSHSARARTRTRTHTRTHVYTYIYIYIYIYICCNISKKSSTVLSSYEI
jgi:hypothetical protein